MTRRLLAAAAALFVVAVGVVAHAPHNATAATTPVTFDVLPRGWRADVGTPVAFDGDYVYLFGDTWTDDGFVRNTVVAGGVVIPGAVPGTAGGSVYWPGDGVQLPDGRLFVVLGEVVDDLAASQAELDSGMAFTGVDTDAFIVSDPSSPMSWRLATKIEDGPWGVASVQFSDQWPIVFTREPRSFETEVWSYDPADPSAAWVAIDADLPDSFGNFSAVQTADGWWGITADGWHNFAVWHADDLAGEWSVVDGFTTEGRTYDHNLNVIGGRVVHRWSNSSGSMRPEYEIVDL